MTTIERQLFLERWSQSRARTRAMIDSVAEEALESAPGPGVRSIRETITHLLACESTVISGLVTGVFPWKEDLERFGNASVGAALEMARDLDAALVQLIRESADEWFGEVPPGSTITRRQWLWESLEHEIHHTGQLAMMIRMAGGEPARIFE